MHFYNPRTSSTVWSLQEDKTTRAALGVGHGGKGLPKTDRHAVARRLEFGGYALGSGLDARERRNVRQS